MHTVREFDTITSLIAEMAIKPTEFFRNAEIICVEADRKLYGKAYVLPFTAKDMDATTIPANAVFFNKFVVTTNEKGGVCPFICTTKPIDPNIITTFAAAIDPAKLTTPFPQDGHMRWKTSTPPTKSLNGYLYNGEHLLTVNKDLFSKTGVKGGIQDIQCIRMPTGAFTMHVLIDDTIYYATFGNDVIAGKDKINFVKGQNNVNTFVTVPRNNEVLVIAGTDNGIFHNGHPVKETVKQKIDLLTVDSEQNRIFYRSEGKIFALRFNNDWTISDTRPMQVNDQVATYNWILSGPAVRNEQKNPGLLLTGWEKTPDGRMYTHSRKIVEIPANILS